MGFPRASTYSAAIYLCQEGRGVSRFVLLYKDLEARLLAGNDNVRL